MTETVAAAETTDRETVAYLTREGGWGARVKVNVADTPEADAAAAAFFERACLYEIAAGPRGYSTAHVDEEASSTVGPALEAYFFPQCEHGLSLTPCAGPGHYPADHPAAY